MFAVLVRSTFVLAILFIALHFANGGIISESAISESRYSRSHSLGSSYTFDRRDGWEQVNVTNLQYKYPTSNTSESNSKSAKRSTTSSGGIGSAVNTVAKMEGIGAAETVKITWYSGDDLKNPSCWANPGWAPTDSSFACALTLEGWVGHPGCLHFLELCNGPDICVFVRVVDSCAGCAKGTKHVDLTKAAFEALADLNLGVLRVQMRIATDPDKWFESLWGPKN